MGIMFWLRGLKMALWDSRRDPRVRDAMRYSLFKQLVEEKGYTPEEAAKIVTQKLGERETP